MFFKRGAVFIFLWLLSERTIDEIGFCKQTVNITLNKGDKTPF